MQLAKSTVEQNYHKQIHSLEVSIKDAINDPVDYGALDIAQEKLDKLATRYQYSDTIGSGVYRLYELQAILHYYNNNYDEALNFIEQAIDIRGKKYERATRLLEMIDSGDTPSVSSFSAPHTVKPTVSDVDRTILTARAAVTSAGFWSLAIGSVGTLVSIAFLFVSPTAMAFAIIAFLVFAYFIISGILLAGVRARSGDDTLKGLLIANIVISTLIIWTILPVLILVTSAIALGRLGKFGGNFSHRLKEYDKILAKVYAYQDAHSVFFYRSPLAVAAFTVATLGFYMLYWVYKHYALVGKSTNEKTYPVLSTIFQVFTVYPLMVRIKRAAIRHGYAKFRYAGGAAAGYIILLILSNAANRAETNSTDAVVAYVVIVLLLAIGSSVVMAVVQRAANASNVAKLGKQHHFRTAYVGEVIIIVLGVIISIAAVGLSFYNASTPTSSELSPEEQSMYLRIEALRAQYSSCSDTLTNWNNTIDTTSASEVDNYNSAWQSCENTRLELNNLVDTYNKSIQTE